MTIEGSFYNVAFIPTAKGYFVVFPGVTRSFSYYPTKEEARAAARQMLHVALIECLLDGAPLPEFFTLEECHQSISPGMEGIKATGDPILMQITYDVEALQNISDQIAALRDADPRLDIEITPEMWKLMTKKNE